MRVICDWILNAKPIRAGNQCFFNACIMVQMNETTKNEEDDDDDDDGQKEKKSNKQTTLEVWRL